MVPSRAGLGCGRLEVRFTTFLGNIGPSIGTRGERIDCSGVVDPLAVATPFDGRAVVVGECFELVADVLRCGFDGVKRIELTILA